MSDEPKTPPAVQRRLDAVGALVDHFLGDDWNGEVTDREAVATAIEALESLGRTDRWKAAIATWAKVVRTNENPTHALTQWAIFTNYKAL